MADRTMYRGDTFVFDVQVKAPPPSFPPGDAVVPQDISGWTMWFTAKNNYADWDSQAVVQLSTTAGGVTFTNPTSGIAEITVPAIATAGFADAAVPLVYDVQVKDLAGRVFTVESGTLTVIPDVTRALA